MVLEDLIPVRTAERKPYEMLPIAFIYATVSIFVAQWIFPSQAAIVAVFMTTIACLPLMINIIGFEKEKLEHHKDYLRDVIYSLFGRAHPERSEPEERLLPFFIFLFLGLTVAVVVWFVVLPKDTAQNLFYTQLNTIREINLGIQGGTTASLFFAKILLNNVKVLAFSVLFSLIYGAGAIFILVWNASVIGVAIGDTMRNALAKAAGVAGSAAIGVAGYSTAVSASVFRYMIHGVPEILAYFIGALAGGLISIAVTRHEWNSDKFEETTYDALGLVVIAILTLILAAILEVAVSPLVTV